jgi:hypothetical protein
MMLHHLNDIASYGFKIITIKKIKSKASNQNKSLNFKNNERLILSKIKNSLIN